MRALPRALILALLLLATFLPASIASAGSLSRARRQVRHDSPSTDHDDDHDSGKLRKARREVRRDKHDDSDHPNHGGHHSSHHGGHYHDHHSYAGLSLGLFSLGHYQPAPPVTIAGPTYLAPQPVYDAPVFSSAVESFANRFPAYPYADGLHGAMIFDDSSFGKAWSGRVQFEFGSDFENLRRSGGAFFIESAGGLGLDFDWDSYRENLPGGGQDELHIGELNVMYRIAETEHSLLRIGAGVGWMGDRYDTDFGVNFSLKADYMPRQPFVFSGELDFGTLGDAETFHAAGTMGVMLDRCELFGGYDYRRIGDVELAGPMVGLRVWF